MAISDTQKVDYLWKKIGYAAAKTDVTSVKEGYNEAIPSPLQIRGDKVMTDAASIPTTIPGANTSVITTFTTALPIECTNDATASTNRTWKTGVTDWISPEFGSTYQIKVYIYTSGVAGSAASLGTQVFASGSGNNDEWFFDYQAGVLNFIGTNLPNGVVFTGKSVYISGAKYSGNFGLVSGVIGNISVANTTMSSSRDLTISTTTSGNIVLAAGGNGIVQITGTDAFSIPSGSTANRPVNPISGLIRFNTDLNSIEYYTGTLWANPSPSSITSQIINPNGTSNAFSLTSNTSTTTGVIVSINGTLQQPSTAYNVSGNVITFTETPAITDVIEVRGLVAGTSAGNTVQSGNTSITFNADQGAIRFTNYGTEYLDIGGTGAIVSLAPSTAVPATTTGNIDLYDSTVYRTAKYIIQSTSSTDSESYEAIVTHNGISATYITVYGVINTGNTVGNLSSSMSGTTVQLKYTAFANSANVRISKNYITL